MWMAMIFVIATVMYWVLAKPKQKVQDWIVQLGLLGLTVAFAFLVQTDVWPNLDPLQPLKAIFMPMSKWIYNHV